MNINGLICFLVVCVCVLLRMCCRLVRLWIRMGSEVWYIEMDMGMNFCGKMCGCDVVCCVWWCGNCC